MTEGVNPMLASLGGRRFTQRRGEKAVTLLVVRGRFFRQRRNVGHQRGVVLVDRPEVPTRWTSVVFLQGVSAHVVHMTRYCIPTCGTWRNQHAPQSLAPLS